MRKLTAAEIDEVSDALFNGRQWSTEIEDFNMNEFTAQVADRNEDKTEREVRKAEREAKKEGTDV